MSAAAIRVICDLLHLICLDKIAFHEKWVGEKAVLIH